MTAVPVDITDFEEATDVETLAALVEELLPTIGRRLFTMDTSHPMTDMPFGQLRLCTLLMTNPNPTMSQIAAEFRISDSAATQLADRLERAGLAERVFAADVSGGLEKNRRSRHLRLTARGRELMLSRQEIRRRGTCAALKQLTPEERHTIQQALRLLLRASQPAMATDESQIPPAG